MAPGRAEYPGLEQMTEVLTLPGILSMTEERMREVLLPRFWFIQPDRFWLWKLNALRAMSNAWRPEYRDSVVAGVAGNRPRGTGGGCSRARGGGVTLTALDCGPLQSDDARRGQPGPAAGA